MTTHKRDAVSRLLRINNKAEEAVVSYVRKTHYFSTHFTRDCV